MIKTDIAYIAGIIDGEGCISLCVNKYRKPRPFSYFIRVNVTNTNEWLCQWLKFALGGGVYHHPDPNPKHKSRWQWVLSSNEALAALKLIYPYLRLKKPQAELAIKFQESRQGKRMKKEELVLAEAQKILMNKLNKRGV